MSVDPYEPPRSGSRQPDGLLDKSALREVVLGWEKLRLLYNLLLLLPGIGIAALLVSQEDLPVSGAVAGALIMGVGANLAYFLGPLAEVYIRGLFRNGEPIGRGRYLILGAGLVVSAGVFGLFLLGVLV